MDANGRAIDEHDGEKEGLITVKNVVTYFCRPVLRQPQVCEQ